MKCLGFSWNAWLQQTPTTYTLYSHLKITAISLFEDSKWILTGMPPLRPPSAKFRKILKFLEPRAQKIKNAIFKNLFSPSIIDNQQVKLRKLNVEHVRKSKVHVHVPFFGPKLHFSDWYCLSIFHAKYGGITFVFTEVISECWVLLIWQHCARWKVLGESFFYDVKWRHWRHEFFVTRNKKKS